MNIREWFLEPTWIRLFRIALVVLLLGNAFTLTAIATDAWDLGKAVNPNPADKETDVAYDTTLGWTPGLYAAKHNVYFGTNFNDVNTASRSNPMGVLISDGQDANTCDPGLLEFGKTYYWRIDEVNAPPDYVTFDGKVWSFTVEPYVYPVRPVMATASSSQNDIMGPDKTIDGSGLDANDQHSTVSEHMWVSGSETGAAWIQYEFDKVYKLDQMWIWNSNQESEPSIGIGAKGVTVEVSTDGTSWITLTEVPEFKQAIGTPDYTHNTTVEFSGALARYIRLTIKSNWGGLSPQYSLSEVRFFHVPMRARQPQPTDEAKDVALDTVLTWHPGREATKHEVYVSTDPNAVLNGTAPVKTVTDHNVALASIMPWYWGPEYSRTYYWKVNEVNDLATPTSWEGDTWSFSTVEYAVIDDFEEYDDLCNRIFFVWSDGAGHYGSIACGVSPASGNGTGSMVGYVYPPFAEQAIVQSGLQSMPFFYDNKHGTAMYSEAELTLSFLRNWIEGGTEELSLWFRGDSANDPERLYVAIADHDYTAVVYHDDAIATQTSIWTQWIIPLQAFADQGINLTNVNSIAIGLGTRGNTTIPGGSGKMFFDDIRLYRVILPEDGLATELDSDGEVNQGDQDTWGAVKRE